MERRAEVSVLWKAITAAVLLPEVLERDLHFFLGKLVALLSTLEPVGRNPSRRMNAYSVLHHLMDGSPCAPEPGEVAVGVGSLLLDLGFRRHDGWLWPERSFGL
jgi:hypothetical protein